MWAFIIGAVFGWLVTIYWMQPHPTTSSDIAPSYDTIMNTSVNDTSSDDISPAPADDSALVDCLSNLTPYRDYSYYGKGPYIVNDVSDVQDCIDSNQ